MTYVIKNRQSGQFLRVPEVITNEDSLWVWGERKRAYEFRSYRAAKLTIEELTQSTEQIEIVQQSAW